MQYILLDIGYQEIRNGQVVRYTDLDGNTISLPTGYGGTVIDANPPAPAWALPDEPDQPEQPSQAVRRVTKQQFIDRLGDDFDRILEASKVSIGVEKWLFRFNALTPDPDGTSIDLDDPRTIEGVQTLELAGLIAPGRAEEILNA